jgi:hypothetical protein
MGVNDKKKGSGMPRERKMVVGERMRVLMVAPLPLPSSVYEIFHN